MAGEIDSLPPTENPDEDPKWTVMIFTGGGRRRRQSAAGRGGRIRLAEIAYAKGPQAADIFVQVNKSTEVPRRLHYAKRAGTMTLTPLPPPQSPRGGALTGFIRDSIRLVNHRPKDHSMPRALGPRLRLRVWPHSHPRWHRRRARLRRVEPDPRESSGQHGGLDGRLETRRSPAHA